MSEETTPTDPDIEKTIEADNMIRKYLSGGSSSGELLGLELKPVTLASLAFMQEADSELLKGIEIEQIKNVILEVLMFLYIHTEDNAKLARLLSRNKNPNAVIREKAYAMGVDLPADKVPEILALIVEMLSEATQTKVEPLPSEDEVVSDKKKADQA
jgi:hypothetical protein